MLAGAAQREAEVGLGEHASALSRLEALEQDGLIPDADAWVALARARLQKEDRERALKAVEQALIKDRNHSVALALRAEFDGQNSRVEEVRSQKAGICRSE